MAEWPLFPLWKPLFFSILPLCSFSLACTTELCGTTALTEMRTFSSLPYGMRDGPRDHTSDKEVVMIERGRKRTAHLASSCAEATKRPLGAGCVTTHSRRKEV